jgi:phosphate transport system substrate-binding protein
MSALAEAFLIEQGAREVERIDGALSGGTEVRGLFDSERTVKAINIETHDPGDFLQNLAANDADIGISIGRMTPSQMATRQTAGDTALPLKEDVVAAQSIAIIVHSDNPVSFLSKDRIAAIFGGLINDWDRVVEKPGRINVYALNETSDAFESFRSRVLGNMTLTADVHRFEDNTQLADAVANDIDSIGFVTFHHTGSAKVLGVSEGGAEPVIPDPFTITSERYPLTQRLYLYSPSERPNPDTQEFIAFTYSTAGRDVMQQEGFIALGSDEEVGNKAVRREYQFLTSRALQLSFKIRFLLGSLTVDSKALLDINRTADFINELDSSKHQVMVFGFTDSTGSPSSNRYFSEQRAQLVADEFRRRGIYPTAVAGFSSDHPVASNDTSEGRSKNRRVEIWLKQSSDTKTANN